MVLFGRYSFGIAGSRAAYRITSRLTIGPDSWICAKAFIGPGVTVGHGAVVAACAVALKDIDPWNIVGGNPAKFVKIRELQTPHPA